MGVGGWEEDVSFDKGAADKRGTPPRASGIPGQRQGPPLSTQDTWLSELHEDEGLPKDSTNRVLLLPTQGSAISLHRLPWQDTRTHNIVPAHLRDACRCLPQQRG